MVWRCINYTSEKWIILLKILVRMVLRVICATKLRKIFLMRKVGLLTFIIVGDGRVKVDIDLSN